MRIRLSFFKGERLARKEEVERENISSIGAFKQGSFGKVYACRLKKWDLLPLHACRLLGNVMNWEYPYHRPEDPCSKLMWFLRSKGLIGNGMPNIPRKINCFLLEESESFLDGEQSDVFE